MPEEWAQAALDTIEAFGVAGLAVEAVARRLGVSKGGFYHHFADRRALLRAALALWEERFEELAVSFGAIDDPRARLSALLRYAAVELEPTVITKLMAASEDADVAAALTRAADSRLTLLERIFTDLGLPRAAARNRALLAYTAYLGLAQLREQVPERVAGQRRLRAYLTEVETVLLAPPSASDGKAQSPGRQMMSATPPP